MYTLQRKTRPTRHMNPTLNPHMVSDICISRGQCMATFHEVVNRFVQIHCPWEDGLPTQFTARWSSDPRVRTQLPSHNSQWGSGEKASFYWQSATTLTGSISPVCYQYVQYLLAGANPSVLNWHRRRLANRNLKIAITLFTSFPSECSTDSPNDPTRSRIIHPTITNWTG
jgi:hypothetical protein